MRERRTNFIRRVAITLLAFALTSASAWSASLNHTIVVIADPHVMGDGLLTNPDNDDWKTYIAGSRKLIDYSQTLFDQAVSDIQTLNPELVLIVGDLTKDGEVVSHNYVKGKLDELKAAGIPTFVIPGNHDLLGTADAKVYGETTTDAQTIGTASAFAELYADYGYGAGSERLENTLTYACEPIEGLVLIGIDSGRFGDLSNTTLDWVCAKAASARGAGKQVIAMMHHPLFPHIVGGETFVENVSVVNYTTVCNRLADAGITTIFTGHIHTSDIAKEWNADKSKTIYDINTGSLCSYPCDYRVVALNNDFTRMLVSTQTVTGESTITADDAKTRLHDGMEKIVSAKLTASGFGTYASYVAPMFADACIYHAEGNENLSTGDNSAESCLSSLQLILSFAKSSIGEEQYNSFSALFNSMLLDKSNYGTDREDQTNDRTLFIDMPITQVSGNCGQTGTDGSDVTWSYDNSLKTLTISGTGAMMYYGSALGADSKWHSTAPWNHLDNEIQKVVVGNGVTYIGSYAFAYCTALASVSLPASVSALGNYVCYTSNVTRIDIPNTTAAATIGEGGFGYCPADLQIAVPSTLLGTYQTADNWSAYAAKLVGVLSEATGFGTGFATGNYEYTRTFKCGIASTVCLPFSLDATQAESVGKFYTFDGIDKTGEKWEVIMKETNTVSTDLSANIPYLFVPYIFDGKSKGDAVELTFSGNVSSAGNGDYYSWTEPGSSSYWTFQGVFYNILWDETHNSEMLGKVYGFAANSYSPEDGSYTVSPGDFVKAGSGASIVSFRAYLQFTGSTGLNAPMRGGTRAVESLPNSMKVKLVSADGSVTAVGTINTTTGDVSIDTWSDMNGRILPEGPAESGMYIHNGKQVLIKY